MKSCPYVSFIVYHYEDLLVFMLSSPPHPSHITRTSLAHLQPSTLSPPRTHLKHALRKVFARHEEESKDRTRARTYDGALEVAMRIVNEKVE